MGTKAKPNELKIIRIYDAPVKTVWDAWTDPKQVAKWWGPRGFTLTTHSKELKVGGIWHYTMHGSDGTDYPNKTLYHEVEKYSKLVYDHGGYDERKPLFRVTVLFSEEDKGKTKMDMTMTLPTPEAAIEIARFIKQAGGNSTWDRLAEYLDKEIEGKETFVINRTFNAPINVMFKMWTDPKHFAKWLPPTGLRMEFLKADITPNGSAMYFMTDDASMKMYGRNNYLEIKSPDRIVYTQQFCDEKGNIGHHPLAPTWPETMLIVVTLNEEDSDKTRVTVHWEPHGNVAREELEAFIKEKPGMTLGWTGSFDKLEECLEKME